MSGELSLCLNCIVFTLEGKKVSENKYVQIFLFWLANLVKFAELKECDFVRVFMDTTTKTYLETKTPFFMLMEKLPCKLQVLGIPTPKTALEGMMWKYYFIDYSQDVYMYCDIDCMTFGPIHKIVDVIKENTIAVHCEGYLDQHDYGAAFSSAELEAAKGMVGFSAGKFLVRGKELQQRIFSNVQSLQKRWTGKSLYTVEQPFFNKAIYGLQEDYLDFDLLTEKNISKDGIDLIRGSTILVDFAGEPGDGDFHFKKILDLFLLFYSDLV
jgi:hypothetical protein